MIDAADLLDVMMTELDKIATTTEGTPKQPLLEVHRRAGEALRAGNLLRPSKLTRTLCACPNERRVRCREDRTYTRLTL
jgi:hypothetical protein